MTVRKPFLSALVACFGLALFVASCAKPSTSGTTCSGGQTDCSGQCINLMGTDSAELRRLRQDVRRGFELSVGRLCVRLWPAQLQRRVRAVGQQQLRHVRQDLQRDAGL